MGKMVELHTWRRNLHNAATIEQKAVFVSLW